MRGGTRCTAIASLVAASLAAVLLAACGDAARPSKRAGGANASGAEAASDAAPPDAAAGASSRLAALGGEALDAGFERALEPRPFEFPRDHGPHPGFRHEWWYVTGNVDGTSGERYGFELTIFRFALAPAGVAASNPDPVRDPPAPAAAATDGGAPGDRSEVSPSRWRTRQVYMAHLAVTDVARGRFHFGERYSRDALSLAGAQARPFRVWLGDWSIGEPAGGGPWRLVASDREYALDLALDPVQPPVANGDRGLSRKSSAPGAASYYYSIPRLAVSGTIARDGAASAVRGTAWLDREWGSGALGPDQQGWDWFALQLDDGSALMFYALRTRGGGRDRHSAGTFVAADGTATPLADSDVRIEATASWDSPRGGRYPARWRVGVPSLGLDLDVKPVLADQELATNPRYWEGAVDVAGARGGARAGGRGYVELVGYAR